MTALWAAWARTPLEDRVWLIALVVAVGWCLVVLDPLGPATIDPDASASVLYFQRIVAGQRLEGFIATTPKPFLTLVYGFAWFFSNDWRELVWQTIGVFGVAVSCAAVLTMRLTLRVGGTLAGLAAAAFVVAALVGSSDLLLEVSRANSLIWALAWWMIAGLAITAAVPRPRLAGAALLVAGLCRFETLALSAVAVAAVAFWWWRGRRAGPLVPGIAERGDAFEARAASVSRSLGRRAMVGAALAVASLPIAMLHDWLLTGDPLFFLSVPARYTAVFNPALAAIPPLTYAGTLVGRLAPEWPLILLAAAGVAVLAASRQWLPLAGILAIGLGVVGLLFRLAMTATYISNRYYEPIDLALILAAAVGAGWLAGQVADRLPRLQRPAVVRLADGVIVAAAMALGVAVLWPALPWDRRATTELADVRASSAFTADVIRFLPGISGAWHVFGTDPQPPDVDPAETAVLVPSRQVARVVVEAHSSLLFVGNLYVFVLQHRLEDLRAGMTIVHDSAADRPINLFQPFELEPGRQATLGGHQVLSVTRDTSVTDPAKRLWLIRL